MPSDKKVRFQKKEDSDSDESFHCRGLSEDLVEQASSDLQPSGSIPNSINVPDDEEYYLYAAGLHRLNSPAQPSKLPSHPYSRGFNRASTVYSSDSDTNQIVHQPFGIGPSRVDSFLGEVAGSPVQVLKSTKPPKTKLKWNIRIPRPQAFTRKVLSPTSETNSAPALNLPTAQAPSLLSPPSSRSSRRQGMVFNASDLSDELKNIASTQEPSGSVT
ncbi:hypothetical protein MJO28_012353 [Puccinia striiformis f. sp. tritici]|uniref:Uncharacterized protein n=1 Tax=Puccinia striiformis f. sp. tritici TaxID=168172 RepID=A0ACC0E0X2_9BASI|nr:hypothetical protein Pst134EB_023623 [Puccinia striiformis f. sp. tritici]KAI7942326.1 hypothetical protein MJO28_012353 [Puccinia striiformis f. sp. tritici]KAI9605898.1 hypothetical protein H4Q26_004268 [Puccinia striiformis f. sp. tritici PST-130]